MSHTCDVLDILSNAPMRSYCGLYRQNILYIQDMSSDRVNAELFKNENLFTLAPDSVQISLRSHETDTTLCSHCTVNCMRQYCSLNVCIVYIELLLNTVIILITLVYSVSDQYWLGFWKVFKRKRSLWMFENFLNIGSFSCIVPNLLNQFCTGTAW